MQLIANDAGTAIAATRALRGKDYTCFECGSLLRLRGGTHRHLHFYHTQKKRLCRQSEKSLEHLNTQALLLSLLGGEAVMECPFPEISRIADVVCHERKWVFEVQCSPISLEEAEARSRDYARAGYSLVWILHDKRFNQKKLSHAEALLRNRPCYFTNMDRAGKGGIYDQFEVIDRGRRLFKGPRLPLKIETLSPCPWPLPKEAPLILHKRLSEWGFYAEGDLYHLFSKNPSSLLRQFEERILKKKTECEKISFFTCLRRYYERFIDFLIKCE